MGCHEIVLAIPNQALSLPIVFFKVKILIS
jgi:hypothetical protein